MAEKQPSGFKMRFEDESQRNRYQEEMVERRIEKLGHRITFLTIFLPVLIGAAVFVGYLDLKTRMGQVFDTGSTDVRSLAEDLESRFSSLSLQNAKLQETVDKLQQTVSKKVSPMDEIYLTIEQNVGSLRETLGKIQTQVKSLASEKASRSEIKQAVESFQADLKPIREEADRLRSTQKTLVEDLRVGISDLSAAVRRGGEDIQDLQKEIQHLSAEKLSPGELEKILKKEQEFYQEKLSALRQSLESEQANVATLKTEVSRLKSVQQDLLKKATIPPQLSQPQSSAPTAPEAAAPSSSAASSKALSPSGSSGVKTPSKRGAITEQNLQ